MRIALVAPPFIAVPPVRYGGTELFVAHLAEGLVHAGHQVIVYANGESRPAGELRWLHERAEWPVSNVGDAAVKDFAHTAWACEDAARQADVVHLNCGPGVVFSRFLDVPFVTTLHHPTEPVLSELYARHPDVQYVAISRFQQSREHLPRITTVHHGLDLSRYRLQVRKQPYLAFLGRITPTKAPHLAIEVARRAGLPLKIAGEVQPAFADYWESMVKPRIDGRDVEFVGEADLAAKNELLGGASAFLFPIEWDEPFGLVMLEAMACGTPVLAFGRGSVPEVVADGVSGWICRDLDDMVRLARRPGIDPAGCRRHVSTHFSISHMTRGYVEVYQQAIAASRSRAESCQQAADRCTESIDGERLHADVSAVLPRVSGSATIVGAPASGRSAGQGGRDGEAGAAGGSQRVS
jgi:glycosyltransferase involved in cell wall biosynthesis